MSPSVLYWVSRFIFIRVITVRVIQGMTSYYNQYILQVGLWTLMVVCVPKLRFQIHFLKESKSIVSYKSIYIQQIKCVFTHLSVNVLHGLKAGGTGLKQTILQQGVRDVVQIKKIKMGQAKKFR